MLYRHYWTMSAAGLGLLVLAAAGNPAAAAGASRGESQGSQGLQAQAPIVLAQNEPKKETVTHKVKRKVKTAWRNMTGYKFDVGCPIVLPVSRTTCTETGKSREDARAKCQTSHALCSVSDAK
jgi:hypothetical protein